MKSNNLVKITEELIKRSSYVDLNNNESAVAEWIYNYLSANTKFTVKKQLVSKNRFNVIATIGNPIVWLGGHMDTVETSNASQLKPTLKNGKLYGRGAVDMKGGIACILNAASTTPNINNIGLFFYCDEEYFFAGMKKFIEKFEGKPELTIIAEPTNLQISNAHRGLIDFRAIVKGISCHASRPAEGVDAIRSAILAAEETRSILSRDYSTAKNGTTTFVISRIAGGTKVGINSQNEIVYGQGTNVVSDTAEISVDIRTAKLGLKANKIINIYKKCLDRIGAKLENVEVKVDLGSLQTDRSKLKYLENAIKASGGKAKYVPSAKMGYGDGQMFFEKTKCPVAYFGPGPSEMCHKSEEYVNVADLSKTTEIFKNILTYYSIRKNARIKP